jgi:anti-sigma factor RsiW
MTCELTQPYLDAYVDREVNAADSLNIQAHLSSCDACSQLHERLEVLRHVIQAQAPRYGAPDGLRARIQSELRVAAPPAALESKPVFDWRWAAMAAAMLVAAIGLWQIPLRPRQEHQSLIAREIVASHVRSLMANHLVDKPSSDRHTVKPWFAGKLDFSPAVKSLDSQGFTVVGGRLDYIDNRPVAAVVYQRGQHMINLFVWPSSQQKAAAPNSLTTNGFNVVTWKVDNMTCWAVSDLNKPELDLFAGLLSRE